MMRSMSLAISRWLFDQIHSRNLIYNQCWEDPELDHAVLKSGPADRIVMITSAGCNALDYLLRDPAEIHGIDMNPHQYALSGTEVGCVGNTVVQQVLRNVGLGCMRDKSLVYLERLRPEKKVDAE